MPAFSECASAAYGLGSVHIDPVEHALPALASLTEKFGIAQAGGGLRLIEDAARNGEPAVAAQFLPRLQAHKADIELGRHAPFPEQYRQGIAAVPAGMAALACQ